jgi:SAM-dependent methyltransferase
MTFDISSQAPGLEMRDPGIWFAQQKSEVSYPSHGNAACLAVEDRSFWFGHRNRCIVSVVRRFPPEGLMLDIGGGNGFVSKSLIEAGFACALVEPGIDGALAAHGRGVDPVICACLEDVGFKPASFAAEGMFDVLEHIQEEVTFLRQAQVILKPRGRLFLTVPAYQFLFSEEDKAAGHFRRYTISSLARILEKSGFRVEFATYIFAPLPPLIFLLRTAPSRLGLRPSSDPKRILAEHAPRGWAFDQMDRLLAAEFKRIETGRAVPFGGSCLCVAVKD